MKKPVVVLRGHHLHILYCFVFKNMENEIAMINSEKFKGDKLQKFLDVYRKIRDEDCRVKIVEGLDDICQLCVYRKRKICSELMPTGPCAVLGDRSFLKLLGFKANQTYDSKTVLQKLKRKYDDFLKKG